MEEGKSGRVESRVVVAGDEEEEEEEGWMQRWPRVVGGYE